MVVIKIVLFILSAIIIIVSLPIVGTALLFVILQVIQYYGLWIEDMREDFKKFQKKLSKEEYRKQ